MIEQGNEAGIMSQLSKCILFIVCVSLIGLLLTCLMFGVQPNQSNVLGAFVGAAVVCPLSFWMLKRHGSRS